MPVEAKFVVQCECEISESVNHFNCSIIDEDWVVACQGTYYYFCFSDIEMKVFTITPLGKVCKVFVWNRMFVCENTGEGLMQSPVYSL